MTLFLAISGTANSEWTPGVKLITFCSVVKIVDQDCLAALHGLSGDALPDLDDDTLGDLGRMSDLKANAQLLRLFVEQQNGKDFVVDDAL